MTVTAAAGDSARYEASAGRVIVVNYPNAVRLRILKTDGASPLGGATFTLTEGESVYTMTVGSDGLSNIEEVEAGKTYVFTETAAPPGYGAIAPMSVTVNADGTVSASPYAVSVMPDELGSYVLLTVPNYPGTELPNTGGPGMSAFRLPGALLAAGAALALALPGLRRGRERRCRQ